MKLPSYQELSKEQDKIYNLSLDESHLVIGPPGTGKTVLALHRARMLKNNGRTCKIIMHSRLLSSYVGAAVKKLDLSGDVTTYNSWFPRLFRRLSGYSVPQIEQYKYDWNKILELANEIQFDAPEDDLLIDEGQDLNQNLYYLLPQLGRTLTIFADENQSITQDRSRIAQIRANAQLRHSTHLLTRNYRNTKEIALLARSFYAGLETGMPDLPLRQGNTPVLRRTPSFDHFVTWLTRFEKANSDLDIGVFTFTLDMQGYIKRALEGKTKNPVQTYSYKHDSAGIDFSIPGIRLVTFQSAKGLEFDAVFVPELQSLPLKTDDPITKTWFYVLTSRARDQLFFSYTGTDHFPLRDIFPKDLLEWQL